MNHLKFKIQILKRSESSHGLIGLFLIGLMGMAPVSALLGMDTKYSGEFLKIGMGVRELSLGGAVISCPQAVSAVYWNPAALIENTKTSGQFIHSEEFAGVLNFDQVSLATSARKGFAYGFGFFRLSVDDIPDTRHALVDAGTDGLSPGDPDYQSPDTDGTEGNGKLDPGERLNFGKIGSFGANENALYVSIAKRKNEKLQIGATLKQIYKSLGTANAYGIGLDVAAIYRPKINWTIGASLSDATTTFLFWNDGVKETTLPTLRIATAYNLRMLKIPVRIQPAFGIDIGIDGEQNQTDFQIGKFTGRFRAGIEAEIKDRICLRFGRDDLGATHIGLGLNTSVGSIDYGLAMGQAYRSLGMSHRIGIVIHFADMKKAFDKIS
ncbi:MAG: hypothetical protein PHW79_07515 [Candidatus Marinimicrobia bacterium]|nr:hypothetical protein [Candidatus Neomarinimicrobiota bacterium]